MKLAPDGVSAIDNITECILLLLNHLILAPRSLTVRVIRSAKNQTDIIENRAKCVRFL